jgi:hypothetical protein
MCMWNEMTKSLNSGWPPCGCKAVADSTGKKSTVFRKS